MDSTNQAIYDKYKFHGDEQRSIVWGSGKNRGLPICPYGCGRPGTLLEMVTQTDGRVIGIYNDHPCNCIFIADMQANEPPSKRKLVIGADGELHDE